MKSFAIALTAFALMGGAVSAQKVTRIATEAAYPPFNFINEAKQLDGFEIELGNELCKRANLTCEWVQTGWDGIIPNLVAGNYDAIMAGMNATPARAAVIMFSEPYKLPDPSAYAAMEGTDIGVIETGVVSAQSNTVQAGMVADTGATLLEFPTPDETVAAVRNGTADAVLSDKDYLLPFIAANDGLVLLKDVTTPGQGVSIGLRQSDTELKATFDTALSSMKADGTLNAMLGKWFTKDVPLF